MENDKLILALDVNTLGEAEELVLALKDVVGTYKIGMQLYYGAGNKAVEMVHRHGGKVFLDLKLHDIPNTVAHAARVLTGYGVEMFNIHTSGGKEMMSRTREAVLDEAEKLGLAPPLLVGVTVLTSIDDDALNTEIG
ncbi:MAG: orotidine-5'-phosphate decarboxylase, partial [Clostridia bacterium]|nr:orotidine-5'-phosphate decarboxylase [Clostridia bacterium]